MKLEDFKVGDMVIINCLSAGKVLRYDNFDPQHKNCVVAQVAGLRDNDLLLLVPCGFGWRLRREYCTTFGIDPDIILQHNGWFAKPEVIERRADSWGDEG